MKNFFETDIYLRAAYYAEVDPYAMLRIPKDKESLLSTTSLISSGLQEVTLANQQVWNVAIGLNHQFTETFGLMTGFRTDRNYLNTGALDPIRTISPAIGDWDLYHFSLGTNLSILKSKFTLGFTMVFNGVNRGNQLVNLGEPNPAFPLSPVRDNAESRYRQVNFTLGYVYDFN